VVRSRIGLSRLCAVHPKNGCFPILPFVHGGVAAARMIASSRVCEDYERRAKAVSEVLEPVSCEGNEMEL
jgi:hypothetical protein